MIAGNKAVVRRFVEAVVNRGDPRVLAELVAPDHVRHAPDGDLYGPEGVRIDVAEWRSGLPDLHLEVADQVAEADRVATRFVLRGTHLGPFLGLVPTGRPVAVAGVSVDRLAGGRLAEAWPCLDALGLLRQVRARP
jgi:predicted ester cyclase